jgi:alkanesulfonate monooxygenase SsuD/methylene tetrahydromethanopterin reductase-like flavin-dependent oxidoreductase (luciferase family)
VPDPTLGVTFRPQLPPEQLRKVAQAAEAAGVPELWLWEDCFLEGGLTTASAALAWTERLRVGVGLLPVPLRNPALVAMEIATLARLFPGRVLPGLGHGVLDWMAQVGAGVASPMRLLGEYTTAVRALLHGETVRIAGRYVQLDGVALDWPPADVPPLWVGARGPKTLRLAGELDHAGRVAGGAGARHRGPHRRRPPGTAAGGRLPGGARPGRRRPAAAGGRPGRGRRRHGGPATSRRHPRPGIPDRDLRPLDHGLTDDGPLDIDNSPV